jgi:hypothetical protein
LRDDNVHLQNTVQLVDALQRADKDFEVMFYPLSRHGIRGPHYQRLMLEFIEKLKTAEPLKERPARSEGAPERRGPRGGRRNVTPPPVVQ